MNTNSQSGSLRETILETSRKLFVSEGYENVSMRRIGQEAGCSPMAVYRHFTSKQELLLSICEESFAHMIRNLERPHPELPLVEQLRARMLIFIRFCVAHPSHYRYAFVDSTFAGLEVPSRRFLRERFKTAVTECIASNNLQLDPEIYTLTLLASMHGAILLLISGHKVVPSREAFLKSVVTTATEVFEKCR